jgi:hypothetical protein
MITRMVSTLATPTVIEGQAIGNLSGWIRVSKNGKLSFTSGPAYMKILVA